MIKYFSKYKRLLGISVFLTVIYSVIGVGIAFLLSGMINSAMEHDIELLKKYILVSIGYIIIVSGIGLLNTYLQGMFRKNIILEFRQDVFHAILNQKYRDFYKKPVGDYMSVLTNDIQAIETAYIESLFGILSAGITFVVALMSLIYINYIIIIFAVLVGAIYILLTSILGSRTTQYKDTWFNALEKYTVRLKELFSGYEVISNFDVFKKLENSFWTINKEENDKKYTFAVKMANLENVNLVLGQSCVLVVLSLGTVLVIRDQLVLGDLIAVAQLLTNIITPLAGMASYLNDIKASRTILNRVIDMIDSSADNTQQDRILIDSLQNCIEFKDVSFSYNETNNILKHINLMIEKGKKYAIIGTSGSGKSTVCKLIMNYFDQYEGDILVDGYNYRTIANDSFLKIFSATQQNIFLFDGTIKENITLFDEFSLERIAEAVHVAGLDNFFQYSGFTLDSFISENGMQLSGGEKQRIAIARSYIRNNGILIFDEATSALDKNMASEIFTRLLQIPDLVCIVVTHKLDEVDKDLYDCIWEIKDGTISQINM